MAASVARSSPSSATCEPPKPPPPSMDSLAQSAGKSWNRGPDAEARRRSLRSQLHSEMRKPDLPLDINILEYIPVDSKSTGPAHLGSTPGEAAIQAHSNSGPAASPVSSSGLS